MGLVLVETTSTYLTVSVRICCPTRGPHNPQATDKHSTPSTPSHLTPHTSLAYLAFLRIFLLLAFVTSLIHRILLCLGEQWDTNTPESQNSQLHRPWHGTAWECTVKAAESAYQIQHP
ncbi:hypothetical protein CMEL01_10398 [Colletotrichum melonis]|uniref:Uncharacterized protein n=1 Tax=Colletotrichum melonis TaxID=1209925 RepID=A0AAI9XE99_9PEZI|nr:hypothetical protein CMEL01_10398 [Colletotrichum melonis]